MEGEEVPPLGIIEFSSLEVLVPESSSSVSTNPKSFIFQSDEDLYKEKHEKQKEHTNTQSFSKAFLKHDRKYLSETGTVF